MESKWIPFEFEEDEEGREILSCQLPYDDEEIIVSDSQFVWIDTFITDGKMGYLDSCNRGFKGLAWMPLPEPYNQKKEKNDGK